MQVTRGSRGYYFASTISNFAGLHTISATLLKQYAKLKLCAPSVSIEEKGAVLEEIFGLIFDERIDTNSKDILSDSIKLILIKSTSERP